MFRLTALLTAALLSGGPAVMALSLPPAIAPLNASPETSLVASSGVRSRWTDADTPKLLLLAETGRSNVEPLNQGKALQVGYPASLVSEQQSLDLRQLSWQAQGDAYVTQIQLFAPQAQAVRWTYALTASEPLLSAQIHVSNLPHLPHLTSGAEAIKLSEQENWATALDSDTLTIELHSLIAPWQLSSHLVLRQGSVLPKRISDIGRADACEVDVACYASNNTLSSAATATNKLMFSDARGNTYLCTGTLINSLDAQGKTSFIPYVMTAAHCISNAYEAGTITTFWAFQASSCGAKSIPTFQTVGGGAELIARDERLDTALIRLNSPPPAGTVFSAWSDELAYNNTGSVVIHHPKGDLKKISLATLKKYENIYNLSFEGTLPYSDDSSFQRVEYQSGFTEVGSSGSGLFEFVAGKTSDFPNGYYLFRGTLSWGDDFQYSKPVACNNPVGRDYFSRFDLFVPQVRQHLTPANPLPVNDGQTAIEYYNVIINHYFMEARVSEITLLDTLKSNGWYRTGKSWGVWLENTANTVKVDRFYGDRAVGGPNSHFFTASAPESASLQIKNSGWQYEGTAFAVAAPLATTGLCPAPLRGLYRSFNQRYQRIYRDSATGLLTTDSNHRYYVQDPNSTGTDIASWMSAQDWVSEGAGKPVMCVR